MQKNGVRLKKRGHENMRIKIMKKRSKKAGLSPGTLIHIGEKKVEKARISIVYYDKDQLQEKEIKDIEESFSFKESTTVSWINIDGIHQVEIIEKIGKHFEIHPLILEDILNTGQRSKIEDMGDYLFLAFKMYEIDKKTREIFSEHVSLILGKNFVITFQEKIGDIFDPVRERIKKRGGRIRQRGSDYLAYALIDAVVDSYYVILEQLSEQIELLEDKLISIPSSETLQSIHTLKRELLLLRKSIWPLREVVSVLIREETTLIQESTGIYLRDVYDHTIQAIDTVETFRDMVSGMLDIYLSSISNRMNEVMKVLTIIATIFIPLTFLAGIYGMNFKYMPELEWSGGYFVVLLAMVIIGIGMVFYFKNKKWL